MTSSHIQFSRVFTLRSNRWKIGPKGLTAKYITIRLERIATNQMANTIIAFDSYIYNRVNLTGARANVLAPDDAKWIPWIFIKNHIKLTCYIVYQMLNPITSFAHPPASCLSLSDIRNRNFRNIYYTPPPRGTPSLEYDYFLELFRVLLLESNNWIGTSSQSRGRAWYGLSSVIECGERRWKADMWRGSGNAFKITLWNTWKQKHLKSSLEHGVNN